MRVLSNRVVFCGALLFWIAAICTFRERMDPQSRSAIWTSLGLLFTLFFGLRQRKPPVTITSLELNSTEASGGLQSSPDRLNGWAVRKLPGHALPADCRVRASKRTHRAGTIDLPSQAIRSKTGFLLASVSCRAGDASPEPELGGGVPTRSRLGNPPMKPNSGQAEVPLSRRLQASPQ